jgi:hypothetical protein
VVKANATQWLGTTVSTPTTTAGRTLDVSVGGEAGLDWANVGSPTTSLALTGTTIATTQKVDVDTIKTNPVVNAGTITFPTTATLASTTNITAGTITTVTNLTNAPTAGDFTATMKTSIGTAVAASAVASVTGAVGSIASGGITTASFAAGAINAAALGADAITAAKIADGAIDRATFAADTGIQPVRSNTAQAGAAGTITLDASASATTDFYVGCWVYLTGGTGVGQARYVSAYNGTSKVATITPNWATNPASDSTFAVLPAAAVNSVVGSVGSVTAGVTVTTNNDKTGYTASTVSDKTGYSLSGTQTFNNTGTWTGSLTGSVGSVTGAVGSISGISFPTGFSTLTVAAIQSGLSTLTAAQVWDYATASITTAQPSANCSRTTSTSPPARGWRRSRCPPTSRRWASTPAATSPA